jgi:hypothetical protein
MVSSEKPLQTIEYNITLEQFLDFNRSVAEENYHAQKRKSVVMGFVEIIIGILFIMVLIAQKNVVENLTLFLILGALLVLFGAYSVIFYKVVFPKQLTASATKQYQKSEYLRGNILVQFYGDRLFEQSGTYSDSIDWENTEGFRETPTLLQVMLKDTRCILIPKTQVLGQVNELKEMFQKISEVYNLPYKKVQV